jgi:hypothetical protein
MPPLMMFLRLLFVLPGFAPSPTFILQFRAVRARYPNVGKVEMVLGPMQVYCAPRATVFTTW